MNNSALYFISVCSYSNSIIVFPLKELFCVWVSLMEFFYYSLFRVSFSLVLNLSCFIFLLCCPIDR